MCIHRKLQKLCWIFAEVTYNFQYFIHTFQFQLLLRIRRRNLILFWHLRILPLKYLSIISIFFTAKSVIGRYKMSDEGRVSEIGLNEVNGYDLQFTCSIFLKFLMICIINWNYNSPHQYYSTIIMYVAKIRLYFLLGTYSFLVYWQCWQAPNFEKPANFWSAIGT